MNSQDLFRTYAENAQAFLIAAREISAGSLSHAPNAGEWSAAYVIHHMADAELQFGVRYANLLSEDIPDIVPFDEAKFPDGLNYGLRSVTHSLAAFEATNNMNCEILRNVSPDGWNRVTLHPARGLISLTELVTLCGNHIGNHIPQLRAASTS